MYLNTDLGKDKEKKSCKVMLRNYLLLSKKKNDALSAQPNFLEE